MSEWSAQAEARSFLEKHRCTGPGMLEAERDLTARFGLVFDHARQSQEKCDGCIAKASAEAEQVKRVANDRSLPRSFRSMAYDWLERRV